LVFKQLSKSVKRLDQRPPKQLQILVVKVYLVALLVYVCLLRALYAVAEDHSILPLYEHPRTVLFIVFISEAARVNAKHLRETTHDLGKNPHPLILAVMQRVLRAIHENRLLL